MCYASRQLITTKANLLAKKYTFSYSDGAGERTFVALVAAVVRGRGWVAMVATLRLEVEEPWCRAPPAVIRASAALTYVPGCGGGTSGWQARHATGRSLWGRGIPLHVRWDAISLSGAPLVMPPLRPKDSPHLWPWPTRVIPWPIPRPPAAS